MVEFGSEAVARVSRGQHDAPERYRELADAINATPNQHEPQGTTLEGWTDVGYTTPAEELPVVQGHRGIDGTVRVNESELDPGRYRVEFGGEAIGEVRVVDPVTHFKSNRADRRRQGQRGRGVYRRRDLYGARWGRG